MVFNMNFAIVEDLKSDLYHLVSLIRQNCEDRQDEVTFSCYLDAEAFLDEFRAGLFHAVFLDIVLGGATGIDAAWKVREVDERIPVIFITSEIGFSLESYGVHAMDYLLKPVSERAIGWCMERIRESLSAPASIDIRIRSGNGTTSRGTLLLDGLIYIESIRNGLLFHTNEGDVQARMSISDLVALLPDNGRFSECGRGLVVNLSHVLEISERGEISLSCGQQIFCSRRRIKEVKEAWSSWRIRELRKGTVYK